MNGLFSLDGKLFSFLNRLADLVILNILFMICCLPVFTIGASVTGMYYITMKMVKNEECYIIKGFFKSFRQNFRQATILWLMALTAGIVLAVDFQIVISMDTQFSKVMQVLLMVVLLIYAFVMAYLFPLLAKFDNTVKNSLRNAFLMSIRHLPFTILLLLIPAAVVMLIYTVPRLFAVFLLMGFTLPAFVGSFLLVNVFQKYMPKEDEPEATEE